MYSKLNEFWKQYSEKKIIGTGNYTVVYEAKNKSTGKYVAIKEFNRQKYTIKSKELKKHIELMENEEKNIIKINETFNCKEENIFYIIMDLCSFNLEHYLKIRNDPFSIDEIRDILFQLNKSFKKLVDNKYHSCIKLSNILIDLEEINKVVVKLSYFDSILFFEGNARSKEVNLATPPEFIKSEETNNKSDIWSLGIIIYYMLTKKYLYEGKTQYELIKIIESNENNNQLSEDQELNDLLNKMLKKNNSERISWEEYFNHPFFKFKNKKNEKYNDNKEENKDFIRKNSTKEFNHITLNDNKELPKFNFICKFHPKEEVNYYCKNCKMNICDNCLDNHPFDHHEVIPFHQIGLNDSELKKIENLLKSIDVNMNKLKKSRENIELLINKMKLCKNNISIYENDSVNDFKGYYINCLEFLCEKTKIEKNVNILNIKDNYIICDYEINKKIMEEPIQILNFLTEKDKNNLEEKAKNEGRSNQFIEANENKIKEDLCDIFVNDQKIDFCYKYKFQKEGKNRVKFLFKRAIKNMCCLFNKCSYITSLNLSHYNANNVNNIEAIFQECSGLQHLDLGNFSTPYITNLSGIFNKCSQLTTINLSQLNTINAETMYAMFSDCSSLTSLNLSNFNTNKVTDMSGMFNKCSSLTSLNLSNFNTSKVKNMYGMFNKCSKLQNVDLSSFDTSNVTDMRIMFNECSSLQNLNLSNFKTDNVDNIDKMFCSCTSLMKLNLIKFNCDNIKTMKDIFLKLNKDCDIICQDKKIEELFNKK